MVSAVTQTRITKALKKTTCLKNFAAQIFKNQGYIMSNNHNGGDYGTRDENGEGTSKKFRGAFVADPLLNEALGISINGRVSRYIFEDVIDVDASSLYPSTILAYDIDVSTQYGKVMLEDEEGNDISYQFMDNFVSRCYILIGNKWFGLPLPKAVFKELDKIA
jgi:hypothetical protein